MIIHINCSKEKDFYTAQVQGLDGVHVTCSTAEIAVASCKVLALHAIAEQIALGKYTAPWSIAFVAHDVADRPLSQAEISVP